MDLIIDDDDVAYDKGSGDEVRAQGVGAYHGLMPLYQEIFENENTNSHVGSVSSSLLLEGLNNIRNKQYSAGAVSGTGTGVVSRGEMTPKLKSSRKQKVTSPKGGEMPRK